LAETTVSTQDFVNSIQPAPTYKGPLIVFVAFLVYYLATAMALPYGAGPDYEAHLDAAHFIFDEGRLATLPADEERLHFTVYGSTRTLRPPLTYIVAAAAAHSLDWTGIDLRLLFRAGPALLCALTLGLIFATLRLYFNNHWYALGGVLLAGLMPQFTFIASHLNDDSGAIFSLTLTLYCLVRLLHEKSTPGLAAMTGIAIGLILLSKFTAWLFLPFAGIALAAFARPQPGRWLSYTAFFTIGIIIGGGWWIGFNIWHYGWYDPLLFKITAQTSAAHMQLAPEAVRSFADEGVNLTGLVIGNYKGFVNETLISTVGNLDWLRLKLGLPQYLLYSLVLITGLAYVPLRWLTTLFWAVRGGAVPNLRNLLFETLLLGAIGFQFFMYARYNLLQEIQVQGKYLLPVLLCSLLLFFAAAEQLGRARWLRQCLPTLAFGSPLGGVRIALVPALMITLIALMHIDALVRFVIPFYHPPPKMLRLGGFHSFDLTSAALIYDTRNLELQSDERGWHIYTLTEDSQIEFNPALCQFFHTNNLVQIKLRSDSAGTLQLFWGNDHGFFITREGRSSTTAKIEPGENTLLLAAGIGNCTRLRLDPTNAAGHQILIREFSVALLSINRVPFR
jgi:hypothetical protein